MTQDAVYDEHEDRNEWSNQVEVVFNEIRSIVMGTKGCVYVLCIVYCV